MKHGTGTHIQWHHDDAIKTAAHDCFERIQFAKDLTALLIQKGTLSTVTSIEADWGSGKTSVINLIKENIRKNYPNVVIIDFAPWLFSFANLEDLVRKFLYDLIVGLNVLGCKTLNKLLKKYAKHYPSFPLQNSLKSLITSWIAKKLGGPKISIEALKKDINKILSQNDKPIAEQSLREEYGSGEIKPHIYLLKTLGLFPVEYNNALHTLNVLFNFQQQEVSFNSEDLRISHPNHLQKLLHPGSDIQEKIL